MISNYDPYPDDDAPPGFEDMTGETEIEFGSYEYECAGCEQFRRVNDVGLCEDCSPKLERDLIRNRDWDYCVSVYGVSDEGREDLRRQVMDKFGKALELIAPSPQDRPNRKRRKRRRRK